MNPSESAAGWSSDRGVAMIATLLVLMLVSALLVGFTAVIMGDQRYRGIDKDRNVAFYGAQAGLEKLSTDLGNLFFVNLAPTSAQVNALTVDANRPAISNINYTQSDGTSGYYISFADNDGDGRPDARNGTVKSGTYTGLIALLTDYTLNAVARTPAGSEVHLQKGIQTVAIPVFQFGMFSDVDLSFFAGANFNFGGRVHTNGNLFLAGGATLTLSDKVTAVGEVIRQNLSNGASINTSPAHNSNIQVLTAPGAYRNLLATEGSEVGALGSAQNANWTNISLSTYNGYIKNGRTGAVALNLPLLTAGGTNPDLVRRPATNTENVDNPVLFGERYFSKASVRILLSDTSADLSSLPTVTGDAPISLEYTTAAPAWYNAGVFDSTHPTLAASGGPTFADTQTSPTTTIRVATTAGSTMVQVNSVSGFPTPLTLLIGGNSIACTGTSTSGSSGTRFTGCSGVPGGLGVGTAVAYTVNAGYLTPDKTGTLGGWIKIEMKDTAGVYHDVTQEILAHGVSGRNTSLTLGCAATEVNPDAIIRIERVRDNLPNCTPNGLNYTDYAPLALFDTREGLVRDSSAGSNVLLGGVMYYVEIDVANLSKWFQGVGAYAGESGPNAYSENGYCVYFSDRRNNRNAANLETGEYGWEDVVNPASSAGTPNGTLDTGEDANQNGVLDTYGEFPSYNGVANSVVAGSTAPLDVTARPTTALTQSQAQNNRSVLFRGALKLTNGGLGNIVTPGLTIVAENPVYIQGDYNANQASGFGDPHAATAVIADSVTILSNSWKDDNSFKYPYSPNSRPRPSQSYYRVAIIGGKNPSFPQPTGWASATDFGTDGGAHNFLRMLESGGTVNYRGAIATFYYSRQADGTYKCCNTVYGAPTRNFFFDTDFLDPAKLPPMTPVFRDLNTLTFSQEVRPGK